jgi:hypothetical protein
LRKATGNFGLEFAAMVATECGSESPELTVVHNRHTPLCGTGNSKTCDVVQENKPVDPFFWSVVWLPSRIQL